MTDELQKRIERLEAELLLARPSVVAAAIRSKATGDVFSLPPPARHHTILQRMGPWFRQHDTQGFVLSDGTFVDRFRAAGIAFNAGQINTLGGPLYSEDLW